MNLIPVVVRRLDLAALCCVGVVTCHRMKPADVPLAPSMAEVFLLADDPSGLRVYWADVTEDRSSAVRLDIDGYQYNLDNRNCSSPNSKNSETKIQVGCNKSSKFGSDQVG